MKPASLLIGFAFLLSASVSSYAAATAEEAQRLTAVFQSYLGKEAGVVTVTPEGDSYKTKLDFAPLFAKIKEPGASAMLTPYEITLTDMGSGKWKVDQNQPLSFAFKIDGKVDMKGSFGAIKATGVFDQALGAFESSSVDMSQFAMEQVTTEQGATSKVVSTVSSMTGTSTMTGTADAADGTSNYSFKTMRQTMSMSSPDNSMPPMDFTFEAPAGSQSVTVKGMKPKALSDLVAWFVAHPSEDLIVASQAELKDKLRAALPVFENVSGTGDMTDVSVNTLVGKFSMAKLEVGVTANGVVADGQLGESFKVSGFKMPDGLVPQFATGLVPESFTLSFNVKDFDAAAPVKLFLDKADFSKKPPVPPEVEADLQKAFMPKGAVTIGFGPGEAMAKVYHLMAEGSMKAGPVGNPSGDALVKLKGFDDIMAALQAAPAEMGLQQMAPMLMMAKGMGKQEQDGALSWAIAMTPEGSVTVNGVDLSKMGGQ